MTTLEFDEIPLSLNDYMDYKATRKRYKPRVKGLTKTEYIDKWKILCIKAIGTTTPEYKTRVRLTAKLWKHNRKYHYDIDNTIGGLKPIIDILVRYGVLLDDTPKLLDVKCDWQPLPKGKPDKMILELEEV